MSDIETIWLVIAGVLGVAVILFVAYLIGSTARSRPRGGRHRAASKNRPHRDTFRTEEPEPEPLKRAAIIVQGADDGLRSQLSAQCAAAGWDQPLWLEVLDGGGAVTAATEARDDAVDVVCVRGDARVQGAVAGVLAGTQTPVSFLPPPPSSTPPSPEESLAEPTAGRRDQQEAHHRATWPGTDPTPAVPRGTSEAMTTALTGQNTRIDIGRAHLGPQADTAKDETARDDTASGAEPVPEIVFLHSLVIGEVVGHDEPALSTRQVARGIVRANPFTASVKPDDEEAVVRPARSVRFATSEQPMTDGEHELRVLDAHLYASRSLKGWTGVARAMVRKSSRGTPMLVPMRSVAFTVVIDNPAPVTVDGQPLESSWPTGETTVAVEPLALVVRR